MRWKSYISAIAVIAALRALDLYVTFRYTPDLGREWNPVISFFGTSWTGFIVIQVIVTAFIAFLMFFYFNRGPTTTDQDGLSFLDFIYVYFFGKLRPWPERIVSFPTNLKRHLIFSGFLFMMITTLISVFAIVHNLLLMAQVERYVDFVARHYRIYFPACFMAVTVFSLYCFFTIEYLHYRRARKPA